MRTALVTGGTKGVGYEIAKMLSRNNYKVIITGRDATNAIAMAQSINPSNVTGVELDLTKTESIMKFSRTCESADVLIHNAGMLSRDNLSSVKETSLQKMFMTNAIGPILLTKYLLPNMIKRNNGSVLFFCPPYAIDKKTSLLTPYMQSKLAQTTFMKSVANMVKKTDVNVAGFWTKYPIYTDALIHRQIGEKSDCMHPAIIARMVELMLLEPDKSLNGTVSFDHDYLISRGESPNTYALGGKPKLLDELFFDHLNKK